MIHPNMVLGQDNCQKFTQRDNGFVSQKGGDEIATKEVDSCFEKPKLLNLQGDLVDVFLFFFLCWLIINMGCCTTYVPVHGCRTEWL